MKLELLVPTSLDEIPLRAYQEFRKIYDQDPENNEFLSEKMVQLFCGIEFKDVVKMKASDLHDMVYHFNNLFGKQAPFKQRFKIGDLELGFIPNFENMSWGEYIDAEKYLSSWETMHKAMAVLYRPITKTKGDKYEIMEYNGASEFAELMKLTPVSIALGANVFFWTLGLELLEALSHYLETEAKTILKTTGAKEHNLPNSGDGINQSMRLLRETFLNSMQSQNSPFTNA